MHTFPANMVLCFSIYTSNNSKKSTSFSKSCRRIFKEIITVRWITFRDNEQIDERQGIVVDVCAHCFCQPRTLLDQAPKTKASNPGKTFANFPTRRGSVSADPQFLIFTITDQTPEL